MLCVQAQFCDSGSDKPRPVGQGNYSLNLRICDEGDACRNVDSSAAAIARANGTVVLEDDPEGLRTAQRTCIEGSYCELGDLKPCLSGTYSLAGASECKSCVPGRYQPDEASTECLGCEAGRSQDSYEEAKCNHCLLGQFSLANASKCTPCGPGRYQPREEQTECILCEAGRYQADPGENNCLECSKSDKTSFCELGADERLTVGRGKYSVNIRRKSCDEDDAWRCNLDSSAAAATMSDGVAVETNREEGERTAERECDKGFYCEEGERKPCPSNLVCPLKGMSKPQRCDAGCANATLTTGPCAVPVEGSEASALNNDAPGPTRCNCPVRSYGYVKRAAQVTVGAETSRRVADLEDVETVTMLACAKCPDGVYCDEPGSEFGHLRLFPGRWQAIEFFESAPDELYKEGVDDCVGTEVLERCAGGSWANFSCEHGFSGPAFSSCMCHTFLHASRAIYETSWLSPSSHHK